MVSDPQRLRFRGHVVSETLALVAAHIGYS